MRIVAAPDSFKGSIGAAGAARALANGWHRVRPADEVIELPLADGGEGTLAVLAAAAPASRWHELRVSGPGTEQVPAAWLEMDGNVAVVELAAAAGLTLLDEPSALTAHSYGVGELIRNALGTGARRVLVALGGSACTDGGTGALAALGALFLDPAGVALPRGGGALARLAAVDLSGLVPPPDGGVSCLTDVRAPLLGPDGAAAVFGPQKGASPADVAVLEAGLARLASLLGGDPAEPGAGAAGGCGYGLAAGFGADLLPGAAELALVAGLPEALTGADLVITGEGQYDATSEAGKVVSAVRTIAAGGPVDGVPVAVFPVTGVPVALVAGRIALPPPRGVRAVELATLAGGVQAAMAEPGRWLTEAGSLLAAAVENS
jgi:glycerate 2-kinase